MVTVEALVLPWVVGAGKLLRHLVVLPASFAFKSLSFVNACIAIAYCGCSCSCDLFCGLHRFRFPLVCVTKYVANTVCDSFLGFSSAFFCVSEESRDGTPEFETHAPRFGTGSTPWKF